MKTTNKVLIGSIIFSLLFTTACSGKKPQPTPAPVAKAPVVEASGKVKAGIEENINLDFNASVSSIYVKEGQLVKKGDVLFTIDLSSIKNEIAQKQNEIDSQEANIIKMVNGSTSNAQSTNNDISVDKDELNRLNNELESIIKSNDRTIATLKSEYNTAFTNMKSAENEYNRNETLFNSGAISKVERDNSKSLFETKKNLEQSAQSALENAKESKQQAVDRQKSSIVQVEKRLENRRLELANPKTYTAGDIESAKKQKAISQNQLDSLRNKLNKSYLNSNNVICDMDQAVISGITIKNSDNVFNNPKLITLINTESLVVEAEVDEEAIKDVTVGADVIIKPVSNSAKQYKGKVLRIADMGVERNGSTVILTDISIIDRDNEIGTGYNVDVEIAKPAGAEVTTEPSPTKK